MNAPPADTARCCPWCGRWALKDDACNWVCCGYAANGAFHIGAGSGQQFCFACGGKLCGLLFHPHTGARQPGTSTQHTAACCGLGVDFCPGGHNSHR